MKVYIFVEENSINKTFASFWKGILKNKIFKYFPFHSIYLFLKELGVTESKPEVTKSSSLQKIV